MTNKLKRGYYWCVACGTKTLHDWHSRLTNQEAETYPSNAPIPDDIFICCKCASGLNDEEWQQANVNF